MECIRCGASNPDGRKYCSECGASLDPRAGPFRELVESLSREQVAAAVQEQFKNQKVVENELTEAVIQRLSDWAKFYVGIPLGILLVALSFFGYEKLSDLNKLVEKAKQDVEPKLKDVKTQADNLKTHADAQSKDLENIFNQQKAEGVKLRAEGIELEATYRKLESQASQYTKATQEIQKAASEAQSANAKAAEAETKVHSLATALGCTVPTQITFSCSLPFESIQQRHPIDSCCGLSGSVVPNTPVAAQNLAKNNFCAAGPPVNIDFDVLHQLQADAAKPGSGITFGSDSQLPRDRGVLRNLPTKAGPLREGTVVRMVAFVMDAHYSNLGTGESVNCHQPDKESNDIHIVLADSYQEKDECNSVTAEMSPHFRPEVWDPNDLNQKNSHLYRFTGQLFFDASHRPCSGGKGSPKRSSLWEIHPVYALDICTDPSNNCKVDSDENWVSFAEKMGVRPSETRLWLPDEISTEFGVGASPRRKGR